MYLWPDGSQFVGTFYAGKREGYGTTTYSDGRTFQVASPIRDGYSYHSTSIRRPFDCLSTVIEITVMYPASRGHAVPIYLFI